MFTEQEKRDLSRIGLPDDENSDDGEEDVMYNHSLYSIASETYREIRRREPVLSHGRVPRTLWSRAQFHPKDSEEVLTRIKGTFYPVNCAWILRHLTTQEYVRAEGIARKPEDIHGPKIDRVSFGIVALMRICWSSDPSSSGVDKRNITRGRRAGHRFDITAVWRHERSVGGNKQWKDVSVEVDEEIAGIWGVDHSDG
ncbi:hypothetical protein MMC18_002503 [Xylographa bjoerkii]|nr:hypothetical protein [Xylographa bjoerkii]